VKIILPIEGNILQTVENLTTFSRHFFLFSAIEIRFTPFFSNVYIHFNIILPFFLGFLSFSVPQVFPRNSDYISLLRHACHMETHLIYSVQCRNKNITCYTTMSFYNEDFLWFFPYCSSALFLFCCLYFVCKEEASLLPGRQNLISPNQVNNPHPAVQTDKYVSHSVRQLQQFAHTFTSYALRFSNFRHAGNMVSWNVHYCYVTRCNCPYLTIW
jgi:hypothetical protein